MQRADPRAEISTAHRASTTLHYVPKWVSVPVHCYPVQVEVLFNWEDLPANAACALDFRLQSSRHLTDLEWEFVRWDLRDPFQELLQQAFPRTRAAAPTVFPCLSLLPWVPQGGNFVLHDLKEEVKILPQFLPPRISCPLRHR